MEDWDGGAPDYYGLGYTHLEDAEEAEAPPREPAARRVRASRIQREVDRSGLGDVQYRRLTRRIDAIHDSQSRFARDFTQALSAAFRATGVDIAWPTFGADYVYPPPDTPPEEGGTVDD
ncbi:hypothetical protein POM88_001235 [Heracleum sosnowskyi]|uniref:Uncharacterized protein n=1 Tax=Heracleum sosnowskyi TaxID=360622 RepID=A0AAD8JBR0_9APIA|nr:hypothetical protein POM88_001235 [Heracleum sosnowskyi]